jgi:hypothetical protein
LAGKARPKSVGSGGETRSKNIGSCWAAGSNSIGDVLDNKAKLYWEKRNSTNPTSNEKKLSLSNFYII